MSHQPKKAGAGASPPLAVVPIVLRPKPDNFKAKLAEGASSISNNGKIYEFQMDARDFQPGDVQLTIGTKSVSIDARHETEEEETEISFEIEIPVGVDRALIEAHMNKHGVLRISAPVTLEVPVPEAKTVVVRSERKTETVTKQVVSSQVVEEIVEAHFWEVDPPSLDPKFQDISGCIEKSESGDGFKLNLDLPPGTAKEDVQVNVYKTLATVEVKPKREAGEPGKLQVEICKKVVLPKQTRHKTLTSVMDVQNGRFTISGLLKTPQPKKPERTEPEKVFEVKRVAPAPKKPTPEPKVGDPLLVVVDSETSLNAEEAKAAEDVTDHVMKEFAIDGDKFETKLDISGWNAGEIEVKALKRVVTVRAQRHESSESLFKMFKIPPRVRHEDLEAVCASVDQLRISSVLQPLCAITPKISADDKPRQGGAGNGAAGGGGVGLRHVLDLTGYAPEQIEISIKNGWIAVKAKQVSGVRDFMHSFQARQFSRKFTIPPGLQPADVRCRLDPLTNTLFITADTK